MVLATKSFLFSVEKEKNKFLNINQGIWQIVLPFPFNYFNTVHFLEIDSINKRVHHEPESSDSFFFFLAMMYCNKAYSCLKLIYVN